MVVVALCPKCHKWSGSNKIEIGKVFRCKYCNRTTVCFDKKTNRQNLRIGHCSDVNRAKVLVQKLNEETK